MQVRLIAIAFAIALGGGSAVAADMRMPVKAPAPTPPIFSWTGFYLGAHGGYGWGLAQPEPGGSPEQHPEGGFGGVQAGYNYQFGSAVLGAEVDISFGELSDAVMDGTFIRLTGKADRFGTARLRLGYAFDRFMPYVTGGFAWMHSKAGISCPAGAAFSLCSVTGPFSLTDASTSVGWTLGGGVEYAFTTNWSAKLEYLHADLGDSTISFTLPVVGPLSSKVNQTLNLVRFGVNYKFGGPY